MAEGNQANAASEKVASGTDAGKKSWLEQQVEKIVGGQKDMQPIIKTCLSVVGFIGGFVAGYFIFGREKDKKLHEQELLIMELKQRGREQENEIRRMEKQLEENKAKNMNPETEAMLSKEEKVQPINGKLNGVIPIRRAERTYLD